MSALDFGARAMAAQLRRRTARHEVLDRLGRGLRAGGLRPIIGAPPSIGAPSPGASAIATGTTYAGAASAPLFTFLRGTWSIWGAAYPKYLFWKCVAATGATPGASGQHGDQAGPCPLARFYSDAPDLEIIHQGATDGYRLYVDDELVQADAIGQNVGSGGQQVFTRLTWGDGSAAYRKSRLYEVEGATSNFWFGGVRLDPLSKIWRAPLRDLDLRVIVHGDSFVEQFPLVRHIGQLMGQPDTRGSGLWGTGFLTDNDGTRNTFIERVDYDIVAPAPHVVIELGGLNDEGLISNDPANMQAAVEPWLDAIQMALPETLVFMTGPMSPKNAPAYRLACRDGKKAACAGRPNVFFIDNLATGFEWVTGSGYTGSEAGDGNADWVTDSGHTHPTDAGSRYLAHRIAQAMAAIVEEELAG